MGNKYRVCGVYSPEPIYSPEDYCVRLNFNISKLVYSLSIFLFHYSHYSCSVSHNVVETTILSINLVPRAFARLGEDGRPILSSAEKSPGNEVAYLWHLQLTWGWKKLSILVTHHQRSRAQSKCLFLIRDFKQPRRRRQQKPHKFAYLTMKNSIFASFAREFFIFWHFGDVLVLSTTSNDMFCSCVDDVSIWWQMFNFVFLCPKRCFQCNSRIVRTNFPSMMSLNNWKMIPETRSHIFRWRSRSGRRRVCLSSLICLCYFSHTQISRYFYYI